MSIDEISSKRGGNNGCPQLSPSLNRFIRSLAPWQREVVLDLGVKGKNYTTVHIDQPEMRYMVWQLCDVLDTAHFSAFVPSTGPEKT